MSNVIIGCYSQPLKTWARREDSSGACSSRTARHSIAQWSFLDLFMLASIFFLFLFKCMLHSELCKIHIKHTSTQSLVYKHTFSKQLRCSSTTYNTTSKAGKANTPLGTCLIKFMSAMLTGSKGTF